MIIESNKLVKGTFKDEYYLFGPNIENKVYNPNQTIKLIITEFLSPNLFFGYEFNEEYYLDEQIDLIYNSMNEFFYFDNMPKIGTVCVAKYKSDKRWYRAKVIGQNPNEKSVDLYFIDYGNIEKFVHLKHIRKLESTFSTQFQQITNIDRLKSQAALFGFIGVKPPVLNFNTDEKSKLKTLTINQTFQVIDVPIMNSERNSDLIQIPFYLIKNDPFSKTDSKLSNWIIKELHWEECNHDESLEAIIQSLYKINYDIYTVNFMIPRSLQKFQKSKKPRKSQNNNIVDIECDKVEILNDTNNENELDYDSNDLSELSVKDLSDDENLKNDINDVLIEKSGSSNKIDKKAVLKEINEDNIDDNSSCSIIKWKISSSLVESVIEGLSWHLPLPESVFRAIVTNIDNNLGFHINVCSDDIARSFKILEKCLEAHYLLCNNSMLKQFVGVVDLVPGTLCLCAHNSTYNRGLIIGQQQLDGKFKCKLFDYGYEVSLEECDIIPISDQFCHLPPLAIECNLSGFNNSCENMSVLKIRFEQLLVKYDYQVLISICYKDKRNVFNWSDDKIILKQPLSVELFMVDEEDSTSNCFSMNKILHDLNQENVSKIETEETEPMSVSKHELFLSCSKTLDDIEDDSSDDNIIDGMKDIYITQKMHDEAELPHPFDKRPVCEYYRTKGRCFKGSKCQDRHVANSDCSDDEEGTEFEWMKLVSYVNRSFERRLRIGSIIGMRVSAIYGYGVFYAFLTHGIIGFENDAHAISLSDNEDSEDSECNVNGLDFPSIHDMEHNLGEYIKFKYAPFNKRTDLLPNTLVAVSVEDKIHRGSITSEISVNRYQVFLVDYGISLEANLESLYLLPKQYCSVFKQQCFMCKLQGVQIKNETDSKLFADWFWTKVNKRILHAKIIDTMEDGMNFVELYDFINDNSFTSLNSLALKEFNV